MTDERSDVPETARAVARAAVAAFGGTWSVRAYYDEDESHAVDVLTCAGAPTVGWTTFSTVTLHVVENLLDGRDLRVELAGVAARDQPGFANVLATAAFYVMKDRWLAAPGVVFPDLVREYVPGTTTPHVMWAEPQPWMPLATVGIPSFGDVHWLLAVPLSDSERELLRRDGYDALDEALGAAGVEFFDLSRRPVC